jgi:hypothetical protein
MSRTFEHMKDQVADDIQHTDAAMKILIGRYLNRRYQQVLRAINWNYYNEDYTIAVTSGTQDYVLPTDFSKELYCVTNGNPLDKYELDTLAKDFYNSLATEGEIKRYAIFYSDDGNQYIRFHYVPNADYSVLLPYTVKPPELNLDADTTVLPVEDLIQMGATADAWRYKRQFNKAGNMELLFNQTLADFIQSKEMQPNEVIQFKPTTFNRDNL